MCPQSPTPNAAPGTCSTNASTWIIGCISPYPPLCLCTWMSILCVCVYTCVYLLLCGSWSHLSRSLCANGQIHSLFVAPFHPLQFSQPLSLECRAPHKISIKKSETLCPGPSGNSTRSIMGHTPGCPQVPLSGAQKAGPWAPSSVHSREASQGGTLLSVHKQNPWPWLDPSLPTESELRDPGPSAYPKAL